MRKLDNNAHSVFLLYYHLILVTAITATKAGIGKTTVSIGLALGLNKIGKKA